ncbi:hypothetical protein G6F40_017966 [Rhizopus arrhizus]|nr:hypothetical protein G6F40_017966 [Rhizopus arrhizus]
MRGPCRRTISWSSAGRTSGIRCFKAQLVRLYHQHGATRKLTQGDIGGDFQLVAQLHGIDAVLQAQLAGDRVVIDEQAAFPPIT